MRTRQILWNIAPLISNLRYFYGVAIIFYKRHLFCMFVLNFFFFKNFLKISYQFGKRLSKIILYAAVRIVEIHIFIGSLKTKNLN